MSSPAVLQRFSAPPQPRGDPASAAGSLLVAAIFLAPWAFGSRPYWAALTLAAVLWTAAALWVGGFLWERRLPMVPPLCVGTVIFLAALAGVSLLNPRSTFDVASRSFLPNPASVPFLPGTVDVATGWTATVEMLGYLFVIPVAADLCRAARWRQRFLGTIALAGLGVSIAGLILKTGEWPQLQDYLERRLWAQGEIFGPFDYHGNAGAFLNFALPAAAWQAATAVSPTRRTGWRCVVGVMYVALFANNSRAALAIGICLSPFCWRIMRQGHATPDHVPPKTRRWWGWLGICAPVALLGAGILFINHDLKPWQRLRRLPAELRQPEYPRYMQSRAAWEMARGRPFFGAGVGTYKVLVQTSSIHSYFFAPAFRPGDPFTVLGHTHEDYLQTLAEWGWIGLGAWALLVAGAFGRLWRWLRQTQFATRTGLAAGTALASVYLHALGDCPLQIPVLQLYAAAFLGLAWGSPPVNRQPAPVED